MSNDEISVGSLPKAKLAVAERLIESDTALSEVFGRRAIFVPTHAMRAIRFARSRLEIF